MTLPESRIVKVKELMVNQKTDIDLRLEQQWLANAKISTAGFEPIYNRYYNEIYRFIYRRTDSQHVADDLCSETFFKAMANIHKFTWQGKSIGNWLYTIALNVIRKHYKLRQQRYVIEIDKFEEHTKLEDINKTYTTDDLVWVLEQLTETELMLIELRYFEGMNFKVVAALMDMKESAVKMKLYRLLLTMKNLIIRKHEQEGI